MLKGDEMCAGCGCVPNGLDYQEARVPALGEAQRFVPMYRHKETSILFCEQCVADNDEKPGFDWNDYTKEVVK